MKDLTETLARALARNGAWSYVEAKDLASRIAALRPNGGFNGTPNSNWMLALHDGRVVAYIYLEAPFAIVDEAIENEVEPLLGDVVAYYGLTHNAPLYRIDPARAEDLMPYPLNEIDLNFDGFDVEDFIYETS